MNVHLDRDEITALLQAEAFAPPRWRKLCFWLGLLLLLLVAYHLLLTLKSQSASLSKEPAPQLIEWQQGQQITIKDPELLACLQQWGAQQNLPPAQQLVIGIQRDRWTLIWLSADDSINFSIEGQPQELCR